MNDKRLISFIALLGFCLILASVIRLAGSSVGSSGQAESAFGAIYLEVSNKSMAKLRMKRKKALEKGLLVQEEGDWVGGALKGGGDSVGVKLRLKGDWLDHIEGTKWSFRIKVKNGGAWKGMRVFSIQRPETRAFLYEWLLHEWLREEGVYGTIL